MDIHVSKTREYLIWTHLKQAVRRRGLACDSNWLKSFNLFLLDMGKIPEGCRYLVRNDKSVGYCKTNCYWSPDRRMANDRLLGRKFNRWTIVEYAGYDQVSSNHLWVCHCDCGNKGVVREYSLGKSKGCGCHKLVPGYGKRGDNSAKSDRPEYRVWIRIRNEHLHEGVGVPENWLTSFDTFLRELGPKPDPNNHNLRLVRINTNLPYSKENCIWRHQ